jgi:hypothetical protein
MTKLPPKVTLVCTQCSYQARRPLSQESGSRGIHETSSEPGLCPKGHGLLVRKDGVQQERWSLWSTLGAIFRARPWPTK